MNTGKSKWLSLWAWVLMLGCCSGFAQQSIDYNTYIKNILVNHPLATKATNNSKYGRAQYKASLGNFDPQLAASTENKFFDSKNYFSQGNIEVKQALFTSHYLKAGYRYMNGLLVNPENTLPVGGQQYIGLEANVLQGFLFDKRRADVLKARFYEAYYNAEEKLQINDLLHAATTTYAEYLLSSKVNALYNEFGMLAQKRLTAIYEMTAIGEKPYMDTLEASILLQSRRLDLQSSELELLKKKNEIDYVFLVESTDKQVAVTLTDSIEGVFSKMKNKLNECMNEVENNPILAKYNTQQRILETEKRLKREMIKPALSINYNFLSKDYSGLTPDVNWNNYKWGANFSFPLFVRKSRNELKMANVLVHTNSMELVNKRNELLNKRQSTIAGIDIIIKQIQFAERSVEYSKLLLEMESMKFNNGESSLFLLNSRESKLLESEVKLNEYKLKYIRMVLDLIYLNGNLNYSI